ncbi:hypothetical protein COLO4_16513 [Corchorus olitorius]|uniref:Uncharacterized protein n=1 Tax=Corchorus olitorius TaxID=93759 RepID=A0A1R3JH48_9ROSI|nr:hypothetical protein COLO4_16513 [Corchorus olitorius]
MSWRFVLNRSVRTMTTLSWHSAAAFGPYVFPSLILSCFGANLHHFAHGYCHLVPFCP